MFASIAPDHCFSYRCLDRVDSILHCDRPLIIQRGLWRSNGFSQIRGVRNADHADFLRELGDGGINEHAPVPALLTVTNAIYNEYEFVRQDARLHEAHAAARGTSTSARTRATSLDSRTRSCSARMQHGARRARLVALDPAALHPRAVGVRRRLLLAPARARCSSDSAARQAPPAEFGDSAQALDYTLAHPSAQRVPTPTTCGRSCRGRARPRVVQRERRATVSRTRSSGRPDHEPRRPIRARTTAAP